MLKPCVGIIVVMSSSDSFFRIVVLPELSRPSTKRRASWSVCRMMGGGVEREGVEEDVFFKVSNVERALGQGADNRQAKAAALADPPGGRSPI